MEYKRKFKTVRELLNSKEFKSKDLSYCDLSYLDLKSLSWATWKGFKFYHTNFKSSGIVFEPISLAEDEKGNHILEYCDFTNCDLSQYDEETEEIVPDEEKFDAKNVSMDNHDFIIFTGGFIQYAILKDNLDLVVKLLDRGSKLELEIDGENHTWDYVHSKKMRDFMESIIGSKDLQNLTSEEKRYLLEIMNTKPEEEGK